MMEERFECGLEFRASSECGVGGAKTAVLGVQDVSGSRLSEPRRF